MSEEVEEGTRAQRFRRWLAQPGFVASAFIHAALLVVSVVGLTAARPLEAGQSEAMPIELITPSEFDQLTKGTKTAKVIDKPPGIKAAKIAEAEPVEPTELKQAKQDVKAPPPPPPPAPEAKAPEPAPPPPPKQAESKPAEPPKPPEAKPIPPQQVSEDALPKQKPAEKPQDQAKPEPPKPDQQKAEQKPEPPKPPVKTPPPPVKTAEPQKPKPPTPTFSADKIAALLDKREPVRTASASRDMVPVTTAGTARGLASKLSISQRSAIDGALREQIAPCWNPPVGAAGAVDLRVTVRFQLSADGTLDGQPDIVQWQSAPGFQAAADSALRAVRRCSPLHLPAEAFDYWRDVQINFDPKDMLGG